MSVDVLGMIAGAMAEMGLDYAFMEYTAEEGVPLPETYFIGEYQELEPVNEGGEEDTVFILTAFSRGSWIRMEEKKEKIKSYFPQIEGRRTVTETGSAAVFYANSMTIPVEDEELKKMQINLTIKEWKVK